MVKDDLQQFRALNGKHRGAPCWHSQIELPPEEKKLLDRAMADHTITGRAVSLWLEQRGIRVATHSIQRHQRKDCRCEND